MNKLSPVHRAPATLVLLLATGISPAWPAGLSAQSRPWANRTLAPQHRTV